MYLKKISIFLILIFTCTLAQAQVKPAKQIVTEAKSNIVQISIDELKIYYVSIPLFIKLK